MSRKDDLKRRVERLLAGEISTRDLDTLFLWLRERSYGNWVVRDIGDFVAHSEERDQGAAWKGIQGFSHITAFMLPRISLAGRIEGPLPGTLAQFKASIRSTFDTVRPEDARSRFGVGYRKAKAAVNSALDAVTAFDGNNVSTSRILTPFEARMLQKLSSVFTAAPAFDDGRLVSELLSSLFKNQLIDRLPAHAPQPFRALVSLYAVEKMHLTRVILEDGKTATLRGGVSPAPDGKRVVVVSAAIPFNLRGVENQIGFPIYSTSLDPIKWCAPELAAQDAPWNEPLEIDAFGKLTAL